MKLHLFVINIVKHGYSLPFIFQPPPFYAANNKSSLRNRSFVEKSIEQLLADNCIEEVSAMPYCCNPLTVAEGDKLRLVLDLRHVNEYLELKKK